MGNRRQQGRRSQRQGAAFERRVKMEARGAGVVIFEVPVPVQILRVHPQNKRLRIARLEEATAPDWLGSYRSRSVAFEAKTTTHESRWSLGARLAGHQGEALSAVASDGGIAAVLICRLGEGVVIDHYLLPWPEADPRPERKSWRWEQMAKWRVPVGSSWADALVCWDDYAERGWLCSGGM